MDNSSRLGIGENTSSLSDRCLLCEQFGVHKGRWVTFLALQDSAERCITCTVLCRAVMIFAPHQTWQENNLVTFSYPSKGSVDLFTSSAYGIDQIVRRRISVFGDLDRSFRLDRQDFVPAKHLTGSTSSPQTWEIVKQWLSRCASDHEHLGCYSNTAHPLPKRVLDLGSDNDPEADVKLYETSGGEIGNYVCLSHCWGENGCSSMTTTNNLESYKANIPLHTLPRTFREAVIFTRWLGVRYLWIDALSILQNSHEDWEQESGAMASIYEHSYLTLSALHASNDSEGLFGGRNRTGREYALTDIRMFVREYVSHAPFDGELERRSHPGFPLLSRAWAFQERLLSPRVLHFGPEEMYWECQGNRDCECHIKPMAVAGSKRRWARLFEIPPGSLTKSDLYKRFEGWKRLVECYTTHDLTFPTDRLPAISGLATRLGRTMPEARYYDGLWHNDPSALLWEASQLASTTVLAFDEVDSNDSVSYGHVAPTWSWATVNKPVTYISLNEDDPIHYKILAPDSELSHAYSTIIRTAGYSGATVQIIRNRKIETIRKARELLVEGPVEDCVWDPTCDTWIFSKAIAWTHSRPCWDWSQNRRQNKCLLRLADTPTEYLFLILGIIEKCSKNDVPLCRRLGLLHIWKNPAGLADEPPLYILGEYPHVPGHRRELFLSNRRVRIV